MKHLGTLVEINLCDRQVDEEVLDHKQACLLCNVAFSGLLFLSSKSNGSFFNIQCCNVVF
jgi:hypothetical protein